MENRNSIIVNILDVFHGVTSEPEKFIDTRRNLVYDARKLLKQTYDSTKKEEPKLPRPSALPELIVQDFDIEQIWQQVELQNNQVMERFNVDVSKLSATQLVFDNMCNEVDNNLLIINNDNDNYTDAEQLELHQKADNDEDDGNGNENLIEENNTDIKESKEKSNKSKRAIADTDTESEGSIDMFEAESEVCDGDNETKNPRYKDFFKSITEQRMSIEDVYKAGVERKSTLELRQECLKMKIKEIEKVAVSEKPWQLKGEITARNRPQNSLLEVNLEFDLIARQAPVMTEETTHILEDIIQQRITDKAFDDVQHKEKPVQSALEFKTKLILDKERSKKSLAQIYEKEYIQQREALYSNTVEQKEKKSKLHQEIKTTMTSLFTKLNALSNFHFTPKPVAPELKIVTNLSAINMEEVAPVVVSDATFLAAEEVKLKFKGDIVGKSEQTDTDKKRERRKKKRKQVQYVKEKCKDTNTFNKLKSGSKYSKERTKKILDKANKEVNVHKMDESSPNASNLKSSITFFTTLEEVQLHIKRKTKNRKTKETLNAKQLKL